MKPKAPYATGDFDEKLSVKTSHTTNKLEPFVWNPAYRLTLALFSLSDAWLRSIKAYSNGRAHRTPVRGMRSTPELAAGVTE